MGILFNWCSVNLAGGKKGGHSLTLEYNHFQYNLRLFEGTRFTRVVWKVSDLNMKMAALVNES